MEVLLYLCLWLILSILSGAVISRFLKVGK